MLRTVAIAGVLLAAGLALGGIADSPVEVTENVRAECWQIHGVDDCAPNPACVVGAVVTKATGVETHCTL